MFSIRKTNRQKKTSQPLLLNSPFYIRYLARRVGSNPVLKLLPQGAKTLLDETLVAVSTFFAGNPLERAGLFPLCRLKSLLPPPPTHTQTCVKQGTSEASILQSRINDFQFIEPPFKETNFRKKMTIAFVGLISATT